LIAKQEAQAAKVANDKFNAELMEKLGKEKAEVLARAEGREPMRTRMPLYCMMLPKREKTHWDYLLEEMKWLANDFHEERKWKYCAAEQLARSAAEQRGMARSASSAAAAAGGKPSADRKQRMIVTTQLAHAVRSFWHEAELRAHGVRADGRSADGHSADGTRGVGHSAVRGARRDTDTDMPDVGAAAGADESKTKGTSKTNGVARRAMRTLSTKALGKSTKAQEVAEVLALQLTIATHENSSTRHPFPQSGIPREAQKEKEKEAAAATAAQPAATGAAASEERRMGGLYSHQQACVQWMDSMSERRLNCVLADDVGAGKTVATLAFLAHLTHRRNFNKPPAPAQQPQQALRPMGEAHPGSRSGVGLASRPGQLRIGQGYYGTCHLVLVAKASALQWALECHRWCPHIGMQVYCGSPAERARLRERWRVEGKDAVRICVCPLNLAWDDRQHFAPRRWHTLVLDSTRMTAEDHPSVADLGQQEPSRGTSPASRGSARGKTKQAKSAKQTMPMTKLKHGWWWPQIDRWFHSQRRVLLVDTALPSRMEGLFLWALFLMPKLFRSEAEVRDWLVAKVADDDRQRLQRRQRDGGSADGSGARGAGSADVADEDGECWRQLRMMEGLIRPFVLRRRADDLRHIWKAASPVETSVACRLTMQQQQAYQQQLKEEGTAAAIASGDLQQLLPLLSRLRTICNYSGDAPEDCLRDSEIAIRASNGNAMSDAVAGDGADGAKGEPAVKAGSALDGRSNGRGRSSGGGRRVATSSMTAVGGQCVIENLCVAAAGARAPIAQAAAAAGIVLAGSPNSKAAALFAAGVAAPGQLAIAGQPPTAAGALKPATASASIPPSSSSPVAAGAVVDAKNALLGPGSPLLYVYTPAFKAMGTVSVAAAAAARSPEVTPTQHRCRAALENSSGKLDALGTLLQQLHHTEKLRLVVCAQNRDAIELLELYLCVCGIRAVCVRDWSTLQQQQRALLHFKSKPALSAAVISSRCLASAAPVLALTGALALVFFEPEWDPAEQRRLRRVLDMWGVSSDGKLQVHHLHSEGTIESALCGQIVQRVRIRDEIARAKAKAEAEEREAEEKRARDAALAAAQALAAEDEITVLPGAPDPFTNANGGTGTGAADGVASAEAAAGAPVAAPAAAPAPSRRKETKEDREARKAREETAKNRKQLGDAEEKESREGAEDLALWQTYGAGGLSRQWLRRLLAEGAAVLWQEVEETAAKEAGEPASKEGKATPKKGKKKEAKATLDPAALLTGVTTAQLGQGWGGAAGDAWEVALLPAIAAVEARTSSGTVSGQGTGAHCCGCRGVWADEHWDVEGEGSEDGAALGAVAAGAAEHVHRLQQQLEQSGQSGNGIATSDGAADSAGLSAVQRYGAVFAWRRLHEQIGARRQQAGRRARRQQEQQWRQWRLRRRLAAQSGTANGGDLEQELQLAVAEKAAASEGGDAMQLDSAGAELQLAAPAGGQNGWCMVGRDYSCHEAARVELAERAADKGSKCPRWRHILAQEQAALDETEAEALASQPVPPASRLLELLCYDGDIREEDCNGSEDDGERGSEHNTHAKRARHDNGKAPFEDASKVVRRDSDRAVWAAAAAYERQIQRLCREAGGSGYVAPCLPHDLCLPPTPLLVADAAALEVGSGGGKWQAQGEYVVQSSLAHELEGAYAAEPTISFGLVTAKQEAREKRELQQLEQQQSGKTNRSPSPVPLQGLAGAPVAVTAGTVGVPAVGVPKLPILTVTTTGGSHKAGASKSGSHKAGAGSSQQQKQRMLLLQQNAQRRKPSQQTLLSEVYYAHGSGWVRPNEYAAKAGAITAARTRGANGAGRFGGGDDHSNYTGMLLHYAVGLPSGSRSSSSSSYGGRHSGSNRAGSMSQGGRKRMRPSWMQPSNGRPGPAGQGTEGEDSAFSAAVAAAAAGDVGPPAVGVRDGLLDSDSQRQLSVTANFAWSANTRRGAMALAQAQGVRCGAKPGASPRPGSATTPSSQSQGGADASVTSATPSSKRARSGSAAGQTGEVSTIDVRPYWLEDLRGDRGYEYGIGLAGASAGVDMLAAGSKYGASYVGSGVSASAKKRGRGGPKGRRPAVREAGTTLPPGSGTSTGATAIGSPANSVGGGGFVGFGGGLSAAGLALQPLEELGNPGKLGVGGMLGGVSSLSTGGLSHVPSGGSLSGGLASSRSLLHEPWSAEEEQALRHGVAWYGDQNWHLVSSIVNNAMRLSNPGR
jgi:SNF2 family DNA or RNA helicase